MKRTVPFLMVVGVSQGLLLEVNGKIFPKDSFPEECKNLLQGVKCNANSYGKYHLESKKDGELTYNKATFGGPEGDQVLEQSWEKDGKVTKAIIENRALKKLSTLEVKDGKTFYSVLDLTDQSKKNSEENWEDNLVVPSTVLTYIKPFAEKITKGEKVKLKIAVLDRRESFSFYIKKVRDEKSLDGESIQVLEMAPSSLIVSLAVKPMYFYVKEKSGELFAFEGESALRRKVGDSFEKMTVRTAYEYKNYAAPASTKTMKTAASKQDCDPASFLNSKMPMKCEVKQ